MPSRNIAVRKDIYDALKKEKQGTESFTRLLQRLLNQRGALDEVRGAWGPARPEEQRLLRRLRPAELRGTK